jgi:hypothetical protein
MGPAFTLKKLAIVTDASSPLATAAGPSGSRYGVRPGKDAGLLTLEGEDKAGKPWHVELLRLWGCSGGAHVYQADLDRDAIQDAVLWIPTCGNGLAPQVHLLSVTFDGAGRPIPFEAEGYFEGEPTGIDSLVDLNRDGKAELIFMNFNDGYWITNVYTVENGRWNRVQGRFSGHTFPLYARFTNRPNKQAVTPASGRKPQAPDLSTLTPTLTGSLAQWRWTKESPGQPKHSLQLIVADRAGKQTTCVPQDWYNSARLVLDAPQGRRVLRLSDEEQASLDPLLQEVVSSGLKVRVYGRRVADSCSPELIWAEP